MNEKGTCNISKCLKFRCFMTFNNVMLFIRYITRYTTRYITSYLVHSFQHHRQFYMRIVIGYVLGRVSDYRLNSPLINSGLCE